MNVATVNESTVNEFESEEGLVYGRIWRQEIKGRNHVKNIINSELKLKKKLMSNEKRKFPL